MSDYQNRLRMQAPFIAGFGFPQIGGSLLAAADRLDELEALLNEVLIRRDPDHDPALVNDEPIEDRIREALSS